LIATKADKIKRSQLAGQKALILQTLEADPETVLIPFSALHKDGLEEIDQILEGLL
jgi:GTP-binding protein